MKRILSRFILITLLLLGTLSVGLYVGTQAALEHYRPQLVAEISDAVGCPVTYRRATIKLTPALEVVLYDGRGPDKVLQDSARRRLSVVLGWF